MEVSWCLVCDYLVSLINFVFFNSFVYVVLSLEGSATIMEYQNVNTAGCYGWLHYTLNYSFSVHRC